MKRLWLLCRSRGLLAASLLALGAAAAGWVFAQAPNREAPIRIGVSLSLTGAYAALGTMQGNGARLWERDVNRRGGVLGRRVELIVRDDRSDAEVSRRIYEDLIRQDRVDFVFGPYSSAITAVVAPVVEQFGYPMLAAGASGDELWTHGYKNIFGLYSLTSRYAIGFLTILAEAGIKRVAIVSMDDAGARGVAEGARRWAPAHRMSVTAFIVRPQANPDLVRAAEEARRSGAQALLLAARLDEAVQMRRALKQIGWSPSAFYVSAGAALPKYFDELGGDAHGSFATSHWEAREDLRYPGAPDFLRAFVATYGERPSYHAALGYAAGQILEQALVKAGSTDRAAVRDALAALDTVSIVGRYAVDRSGAQAKGLALIVQWQGDQREIVWPEELRTARPIVLK